MNWIDIAIIGIITINIILGWYKGLIRSVVNVVSMILGFIAAKAYHSTMAVLLNEHFQLWDKIKLAISESFTRVNFTYDQGYSQDQVTSQLSEAPYLNTLMDQFFSRGGSDSLMASSGQEFSQRFSEWAATHILNIVSMIAVFIIVFIAIRIIGYLLAKIFDAPVLKGVNKLSGLLFGVVKGVFFAMLFVLALVMVSPFLDNTEVIRVLENSYLGMILYKNNIILIIFQYFI